MMKNNLKLMLITAIGAVTSFTACKKDGPLPDVNEEELITTLTLKFSNAADPADIKTFTWKDIDGDTGNPPIIDNITLAANSTYTVEIDALLNESELPAEDIRAEVEEESADHLIVYKPTGNLTITATDKDVNNLPIGLEASAVTTAAGTGTLQVILRHQPEGAKDGTEAPGSTDLDATFNVTVQ